MAIKGFGSGSNQIDSLEDVHGLSWADLKDTIEDWGVRWFKGYADFANITSSTAAAAARTSRTRALLLGYMVWLARHQNGNDRTPEIDVPPQLVAFSHEIDRLLTRVSQTPLNPANS